MICKATLRQVTMSAVRYSVIVYRRHPIADDPTNMILGPSPRYDRYYVYSCNMRLLNAIHDVSD